MDPKENKRRLWKSVDFDVYQKHVTISTIGSTTESAEEIDDKIVYMEDLEKRKQVYGICGECNEPGTGDDWISDTKVALKSLDNSYCISTEFLNEIKTHLQIYLWDVIQCYGITQDPNTKDYMMVLEYCGGGNLRNHYMNHESEPVNLDFTKTTLLSECFDCQLDELDLNEINQDEENNTE
ncbi:unnamed protein product [Rhizophagus irregularis]|nr:unnamed protein product [Rhizophagus irregularis]